MQLAVLACVFPHALHACATMSWYTHAATHTPTHHPARRPLTSPTTPTCRTKCCSARRSSSATAWATTGWTASRSTRQRWVGGPAGRAAASAAAAAGWSWGRCRCRCCWERRRCRHHKWCSRRRFCLALLTLKPTSPLAYLPHPHRACHTQVVTDDMWETRFDRFPVHPPRTKVGRGWGSRRGWQGCVGSHAGSFCRPSGTWLCCRRVRVRVRRVGTLVEGLVATPAHPARPTPTPPHPTPPHCRRNTTCCAPSLTPTSPTTTRSRRCRRWVGGWE